jgi:hypothetical protein
MSASMPDFRIMPVKAPAAISMPTIIRAAGACASTRARWVAAPG